MEKLSWNKLTPNQVVAARLRTARVLHGWTQDEAAKQLEPYLGKRWSRVVFSAAERSITGGRIRQFTADEIVAFAAAFDVPVSWFFVAGPATEAVAVPGAYSALTRGELNKLATGDLEAREAQLNDEYIKREIAQAKADVAGPPAARGKRKGKR